MTSRVTVAIPVFNGMPFLPKALDSVLAQTHTDLDVVIIDNASTDDTVGYVKTVDDKRVRLIQNETNVGLDGNWNKALDEAGSSPFWKLVCADDLLSPDAIRTEVAALEAHPSAAMTASQRTIIDDDEKVIIKARGLANLDGLVDGRKAVRRSVMLGTNLMGEPTSVLVRSTALKEAGPFDNTYHFCIDLDLWTRVLLHGDLVAIRQPLASFRVGSSSNSLSIARKQRTQAIGEFKHLASDGRWGITKAELLAGMAAATAQTEARMVLYRVLDYRRRKAEGRKG